jgi:hypothetical protein
VRLEAGAAPALQQRQPVFLRQHQIENDDVVVGRLGLVSALFAVVGDIHGKTFFFQSLTEGSNQRLVIFNKQDTHG